MSDYAGPARPTEPEFKESGDRLRSLLHTGTTSGASWDEFTTAADAHTACQAARAMEDLAGLDAEAEVTYDPIAELEAAEDERALAWGDLEAGK